VDRLVVKEAVRSRLADSIELALTLAGGRVIVSEEEEAGRRMTACTAHTSPVRLIPT